MMSSRKAAILTALLTGAPLHFCIAQDSAMNAYGALWLGMNSIDGEQSIKDISSRIGVKGEIQGDHDQLMFARLEYAVKTVNRSSGTVSIDTHGATGYGEVDKDVSLRLGYLGVKGDWGQVSIGKQWSIYYNVAVMTDMFPAGGGTSTGAYASATDGGTTGTGRAEESIQYRIAVLEQRLKLGFQYQSQTALPINELNQAYYRDGIQPSYDHTASASVQYDLGKFQIAFAHHYLKYDMTAMSQELQAPCGGGAGNCPIVTIDRINGDSIGSNTTGLSDRLTLGQTLNLGANTSGAASIIGLSYKNDRWTLAGTVSQTNRHELFSRTVVSPNSQLSWQSQTLVKTQGLELYSQYNINKHVSLHAGINKQTLDAQSEQLLGQKQYQDFILLGSRYLLSEAQGAYLFAQYQINDTYYGNRQAKDEITIGGFYPF